jgi:hypothetical protein
MLSHVFNCLFGRNFFVLLLAAICLYGVTFLFNKAFIMPLQRSLFPQLADFACLIFLPHGVRVIMAWLYGWRSLIPMVVAHFVVGYMIFDPADLDVGHYLAASLVGGSVAIWACELLRLSGYPIFANEGPDMNWRKLIVIGFIASILNSIGNTLVYQSFIDTEAHLETIISYVLGDTLGVIVALVLAMFTLRLYRLRTVGAG